MVHIPNHYQNVLQDAIGSFGFICVTLFFMISAYGMQLSVERKKDYLSHFWRNRLSALLVPCFLINIFIYVINLIIQKQTAIDLLWHINNYVIVLLGYCLWFYIVMIGKKWLRIKQLWITDLLLVSGVVISSLCLYFSTNDSAISAAMGWCYERYGLIWGLLLYRFMPTIKLWLTNNRVKKIAIFTILSLFLGVAYLKYKTVFFYGEYLLKVILGVAIIIWMSLLTIKRKFGNKMSLYLGNISYEIYLSHGFIMSILAFVFPSITSGLFILLTYIATILFSVGVHYIAQKIVLRLRV